MVQVRRVACIMRSGGSLLWSRAGFYSGLPDTRIQRLRRSGMTFNKPRGRDVLSKAFESRIRICPLAAVGDLYSTPYVLQQQVRHGASQAAALLASPLDPYSSVGNIARVRRREKGDERAAAVLAARADEERAVLDPHKVWHVGVVDVWHTSSSSSRAAEKMTVQLPQAHPLYYKAAWAEGASGEESAAAVIQRHTTTNPSHGQEEETLILGSEVRRYLQKSGDATRLPGRVTRNLSIPSEAAEKAAAAAEVPIHYYLIPCIDPHLMQRIYGREEAQVELISAYRNVLFECSELPNGGYLDILRVPALGLDSWDSNNKLNDLPPVWLVEIGKLNQQSVIKAFHRLPPDTKEALMQNPAFTVEIYVPPVWLQHFVTAFLEEAWETPESTLRPGRTSLYPGLPPPRSLLAMEGWVGKRPELTMAIESEGRSLLKGQPRQLDGSAVTEMEVFTSLRVFGSREEERERLAAEASTLNATEGEGRVTADDEGDDESDVTAPATAENTRQEK